MKLVTTGKMAYQLQLDNGHFAGSLIYQDGNFDHAGIFTDAGYELEKAGTGKWVTKKTGDPSILASCSVELEGRMRVQHGSNYYSFVKPLNWKTRFCLLNRQKEEIAAFIPALNWVMGSCNFTLQLNEEYCHETEPFLILHALHCAVCGMAMLNGLMIPAIGNLNE